MPRDVFISYGHEDAKVANRICELLERKGISCWIAPRDIPVGGLWPRAIVEGIARCHVLLVVLSQNTNRSRQIPREVEIADRKRLDVITLRLADVSLPRDLAFFLGNRQAVDAFGRDFESAIDSLVRTIRRSPRYPADLTIDSGDRDNAPPPRSPRSWLLRRLLGRLRTRSRMIQLTGAGLALILLILAAYVYGLNEGEQQLREHNYAASIKYFDRALILTPSNARALEDRARAYHGLGKDTTALADIDRALSIEGANNPEPHLLKGGILEGLHRYDQALKEYSTAISLTQNPAVIERAKKAQLAATGESWLAQLDGGTPPSLWQAIIPKRSEELGAVRQRSVNRCEETQDEKYTCYYNSAFEKVPAVEERVVLVRGDNGQWQVDGYGYK